MQPEALEKYKKAGKIVRDIFGSLKVQPGTKILALADDIEAELMRKGAKPAFPVNISINEVAAHYTPEFGDETTVKPGDIVKVDIGAHVDGYIADASVSFCSEKNSNESAMINASDNALSQALKAMRPGVKICEVSEIIESEILSKGFVPVGNLTGHGLDQYIFHGDITIPNVKNNNQYELKDGDVFALEPFATNGAGKIKETDHVMIFRYKQDRLGRLNETRAILAVARDELKGLPFCKRWFPNLGVRFDLAVRQLVALGALEAYPVLREVAKAKVSQSEHTVIVRDKPLVITRDLV